MAKKPAYWLVIGLILFLLILGFTGYIYGSQPIPQTIAQIREGIATITKPDISPKLANSTIEGLSSQTYLNVKGTFVSQQNNSLTIKDIRQQQTTYVFPDNFQVSCWPRYKESIDGQKIDVASAWIDLDRNFDIYLEGEVRKPIIEVLPGLKSGTPIIVRSNPSENQVKDLKQLIIIGCPGE